MIKKKTVPTWQRDGRARPARKCVCVLSHIYYTYITQNRDSTMAPGRTHHTHTYIYVYIVQPYFIVVVVS